MTAATMNRVKFTSLIDCDAEDMDLMTREYVSITNADALTERALDMLKGQKGIYGGGQVCLYEHGLQTATRCVLNLLQGFYRFRIMKFKTFLRLYKTLLSQI